MTVSFVSSSSDLIWPRFPRPSPRSSSSLAHFIQLLDLGWPPGGFGYEERVKNHRLLVPKMQKSHEITRQIGRDCYRGHNPTRLPVILLWTLSLDFNITISGISGISGKGFECVEQGTSFGKMLMLSDSIM